MENILTQHTINPFEVTETPLEGRNLIEASAGTGKTFSLAVMAVRLIVEQGMLPKEILMVTFTDMATAELQERVRHFIREAYRYAANGIEPKTEQLKTVVDKCPQQAQNNLTQAIQQLDELNISTIHGFCQRTLSEFAFETGEAFGKELVKDVTPFYEKFILQIFRDKISNLNLIQIQAILNYKVSVNSSWKIIFTKEVLKNFLKDSNGIEFKNFEEYCLKQTQSTNKKLIAKFNAIKQQPEIKLFLDSLHELQKITCIQDTLEQNYLLDFDRMIENLHHVKLNIINHLQNKYKCLFVDEFQDTDSKQYEIFKTIFHNEHHIVFYIGDPKQAIYGFRGAEINTYLKAKNDIENVYTLNTNFRSAKSLVDTLNKVFDNQNILDKRNPFYFEITGNEIKHLPIQANNDLDISFIYSNNPIEKSFYIQPFEDIQSTAKDIQSLLTYGKNDDQSPILPQQIAFIARSNPDLRVMKQKLALLGIPAVIINEDKIFESEEFSFVRIILNAINSRTQSDLLQFLDYKIFNISFQELHQYDLDIIINQFYTYQLMVNENGIYDTLMQIYRDFNIEQKSLENNDLHLQFWANCNQIAEQLQCIQIQYNFTFKELLHKINRNEIGNEDEYITRVESDEQAVQLLTIHKSKGLEFDYV
ncbi:MAG TPA: UvrD-helicase domain-containing protein, partial [Faecalibacter sp.]